MTLNADSKLRRAGIKTWVPALLFFLAVVLTILTTWNTSLYALDGDASSELVLANHLNETGTLFSKDWYYSSELRVLNTQLVFAPLFSVFSDWHMVRFTGTLILQALMVLSFFYLCRQARLSAGAFFLGGALLLLPASVTYGRFVLYQSYYIPHIAIGFTIVALFMSAMRHHAQKHRPAAMIRLALLCALSLVSGLGGVRQGVVTHAPLLLLLLVLLFQDAKGKPLAKALKEHGPGTAVACFAAAAFALGYVINSRYLSSAFIFRDYNTLSLDLFDVTHLADMLFGLLHFFGLRESVRAFSLLGILSLGAAFSFVCCLLRGVWLLICKSHDPSPARRFLGLFCVSSTLVMLCIYLLVASGWYYALYLLPAIIWVVPLIAAQFDSLPSRASQLRREDLCMLLSTLLLVANGLVNTAFFASSGELFPQRYHGIGYENMVQGQQLLKPVEFLQENGYEYGYADFWTASSVTEVSDGGIRVVNILLNCYDRPLVRYEHLTLKSIFDVETDKTFLLLTGYQNRAYVEMPYEDKGELVYDDGEFVIYHFDDPSLLRAYTN